MRYLELLLRIDFQPLLGIVNQFLTTAFFRYSSFFTYCLHPPPAIDTIIAPCLCLRYLFASGRPVEGRIDM